MLNLQNIGILNLTSEFVENICSSEFTEAPDPNFVINFANCTNRSIQYLITTIKTISCKQNIWTLINNEGINTQQVQVWIFYVLHYGLNASASYQEKERALLSAHLYFLLLLQPGSDGNQFHHSIIYEKAINTFKIICDMKKQKKGRKLKQADEPDEEEVSLTLSQELSLLGTFMEVLKCFCRLLSLYSLKTKSSELKQSVEILILVIKSFATDLAAVSSTSDTESTPSTLAFQGLHFLVNSKHGTVEELSLLVFRLLMTTITMLHSSGSGAISRGAVKQAQSAMSLVESVHDDHKQSVNHSVWKLMQNVIAQCPDRMENRIHVAEFVSSFISKMPLPWYVDFIGWLKRFSNHSKIGYRVGAITVIGKLLLRPERASNNENDGTEEAQNALLFHNSILEAVISAVVDVAPTVRAKALVVLADIMEERSVPLSVFSEVMQRSFNSSFKKIAKTPLQGVTPLKTPEVPCETPYVLNTLSAASAFEFHPSGDNMLSIIRDYIEEEKSVVRKSALIALEAALCNGYIAANKDALLLFDERCRDPLLSIRKSAIQSITKVVTVYPDNVDAQQTWISCLFPSIMDVETSVQDRASQLIQEKILDKIYEDDDLVWKLLWFLNTEAGSQNRVYLQKVAKEWNNQKKLKINLLKKVISYLKEDGYKGQAWLLLRMFTLFIGDPIVSSSIVDHWKNEREQNNSTNLQIDMISTIGQVATFIDVDGKQPLIDDLKSQIESGRCSIELIGHIFEAVYKLTASQCANRSECNSIMNAWSKKLMTKCDEYLSDVILDSSQASYNEALLINHLYVVGEAAQRNSQNVPNRLLLSIQALLTHPSKEDKESSSQPLSQFGDSGVPVPVRAHTIFNLGRICFQNEALAKKCVPAFARELEVCPHQEIRSNALSILTDLCVLQTQLVDPFLQEMTNCLGDDCVVVRKHAVILLSSLLRKEYVKWKDTLLFKFLHAACDEVEEIRSLSRYMLLEQLLRGNAAGNLFYRNFVPCLFYFNSYEGQKVHKFSKTDRERKLFDLSSKSEKRMEIYKFILQNMEDEHRINLTGKLCTDVLEAFVEGGIPLHKDTRNFLTDTLSVLCCKEIRLKCLRSREEGEAEEELVADNPAEQLKAIKSVAKQKLILRTVKMNLVENIIPIIISLKQMLAQLKSPLLRHVMLYLKEVMKEYRTEVQVILSADKVLASEIEFDLKRFEREQEGLQTVTLQTRQSPSVPLPGTPSRNQTPTQAQRITTPATLKRRNRPMNVEAILNSAKKVLNTPLPDSDKKRQTSFPPSSFISENSILSVGVQPENRAASTPEKSSVNLTFARDISVIAPPERVPPPPLLLPHPEKAPSTRTWNVTSPSHPRVRFSSSSKTRRKEIVE